MNMSTLPSAAAAATDPPPIDLRPRPLTDDVFQSAEEAVLAEGQADAFADVSPPAAAAVDTARQAGRRASLLMNGVRSHVAAKPCQSALLAAAAGALAALVLRSQLRGRFPTQQSQTLRGLRLWR